MTSPGKIIETVSKHIVNHQWVLIDEMLDGIDLMESNVILLTYVRATFPVRQKLLKWENAVSNIKFELEQRDLNANKLLKGLIDDS